ncbi:hypothetical protein D3C80_1890820 [compost metagenome]
MPFTQNSIRVAPSSIKVAKTYRFYAVSMIIVSKDLLKHELGMTVWIDWEFRVVFIYGCIIWIPEDSCC